MSVHLSLQHAEQREYYYTNVFSPLAEMWLCASVRAHVTWPHGDAILLIKIIPMFKTPRGLYFTYFIY